MHLLKLSSSGAAQWVDTFDSGITGLNFDVDAGGNTYVSATFSGTVDVDPSSGTKTFKAGPWTDLILVEKLDTNGHLVWALQNGPNQEASHGGAIKVDANGNIDVSAYGTWSNYTMSPGFSFSSGKKTITGNLAQFDNNGNLKWLDTVTGSLTGVDSAGNVYVDASGALAKYNSAGTAQWTSVDVHANNEGNSPGNGG
jgi:hypothetical protein